MNMNISMFRAERKVKIKNVIISILIAKQGKSADFINMIMGEKNLKLDDFIEFNAMIKGPITKKSVCSIFFPYSYSAHAKAMTLFLLGLRYRKNIKHDISVCVSHLVNRYSDFRMEDPCLGYDDNSEFELK